MNVAAYLEKRRDFEARANQFRATCPACFMPPATCYCSHIRTFNPKIKFVILIHPLEIRRKIATGRMAHLCLAGSELLRGQEFTDCWRLNELLQSDLYEPVVLFPNTRALNLSSSSLGERRCVFKDKTKTPLIVVADGTWSTAKKTVRRSKNLVGLPHICFTPRGPSQFRVRKQPRPDCVSSIEAIHETIELLAPAVDYDISSRAHDNLLDVFDAMVESQLRFVELSRSRPSRYTRARTPVAIR